MATATKTTTNVWNDFAVLQPSTPQFNKRGEPVKWKVQINQHGQFRCGCPSFIFSKVQPRSCKHTRRCELEQGKPMGSTALPVAQKAMTTQQTQHPQYASAVTICTAMLDDARVKVSETQMHAMCAVLAQKLAAFVPATHKPVHTQTTVTQVTRLIVFDD